MIFHDDKEQVWRWPVRRTKGNTVSDRLTRHRHRNGAVDHKFAAKIDVIRLPFDVVVDATTVIEKVRQAFDVEVQNESKRASRLMAHMYTALDAAYPSSFNQKQRNHEISVTLARLLFLMFGDDTDMWQPDAFRNLVQHRTNRNGSDLADALNGLFEQLNSPDAPHGPFEGFKYVNGGIFAEPLLLPPLGSDFRNAILNACAVDWSDISPAIFGSMFQAVRDSETRRSLGEHYTSEENILKTLNPLFLDEFRSQLDEALTRDTPRKRSNALMDLHDRLGRIRFMDPACGCGNFIVVAYRELRAIELALLEGLRDSDVELGRAGEGDALLLANVGLKVTLDHFHGIEIDEWPARIAETAMFLVDRQSDLKLLNHLGWAPDRLPIQNQANIVVGNALRIDWTQLCTPSSDVIIAGNPPFLGISQRSTEQTADLEAVWGSGYHGTLDYVTGWHAKALLYFGSVSANWAFVATNSVTQGEAVAPLFDPIVQAGWRISFAHRTFRWTSEASGAAAVHCVIIGFTRSQKRARLFSYASPDAKPVELPPVGNITPYLTDGPTVIVHASSKPLNPQLGEVAYGNKPTDGGFLVVETTDYRRVMTDPIAVKYVRRYVGARELLHDVDRHCLWLVNASEAELRDSPILRERVQGVKEFRARSRAASTQAAAKQAHLFRQISQPETAYLCIPRHVSEGRRYFTAARYEPDVICSDANFLASDEDGFMFAIISSTMFITWQRTVGGRIKSDLRFNKLLTWNTFPLPLVTPSQRGEIIAAGAAILEARAQELHRSLAAMYEVDNMPSALMAAHDHLDHLIDNSFGLDGMDSTLPQRQRALFGAYEEIVRPCGSASSSGSIRPTTGDAAKPDAAD